MKLKRPLVLDRPHCLPPALKYRRGRGRHQGARPTLGDRFDEQAHKLVPSSPRSNEHVSSTSDLDEGMSYPCTTCPRTSACQR